MPAKRELQSGLLDQPAMCTTLEKLNTGLNSLKRKSITSMKKITEDACSVEFVIALEF
jgi:hypothetical protein